MKSHYVFKEGRIIQAIEDGKVIINEMNEESSAHYYVIDDCPPFQSMIDGTMIHSKSQYRDHLRKHDCVEIGNDSSLTTRRKPLEPPKGLKETIARQVYDKLSY